MNDGRRKKLIEAALPLAAINRESSREKSIRHGHPSTLHLWWARRPLAACRAVLFAQLVDDPSSRPDRFPTEAAQGAERRRLCRLIEDLVRWESTADEALLRQARQEIQQSSGGRPPAVVDPFCGSGSISLEAQRLGLEARAGDLNPVAVLITRSLIDIPARFNGQPGTRGLAEDIRHYGRRLCRQAEGRIGHLYPTVQLPPEHGGREATVIAWLWTRTVASPDPALGGVPVPLTRTFWLGRDRRRPAWVEPVIDRERGGYRFEVRQGRGRPPEGTVDRRGGRCLLSGRPLPFSYIRAEARAGRLGRRLLAVVARGPKGRVYLAPPGGEAAAASAEKQPDGRPDAAVPHPFHGVPLPHNPRDFKTPNYGMKTFGDLFAPRQLRALDTFSGLVGELREQVLRDARAAGRADDGVGLDDGGTGATAYADAVATYLGFAVVKATNLWSALTTWMSDRGALREVFARQAVAMTWDFAEANPFSASGGGFLQFVSRIAAVVDRLPPRPEAIGRCHRLDATVPPVEAGTGACIVCTDPPYYDNISYADLSDFAYLWLRRSVGRIHPSLFRTALTPKGEELVAVPYRFGGDRQTARRFFQSGLTQALRHVRARHRPDIPMTIFYGFRQSETGGGRRGTSSTGWEAMLAALLQAGFTITASWPIRTESSGRVLAQGTNALASSIVLVCRPRSASAPAATQREFAARLGPELGRALRELQQGGIAPVDLAQAALGRGMAVFSRYDRVLADDGAPLAVRAALELITQVVDEHLAARAAACDPATRWALGWFERYGFQAGPCEEAGPGGGRDDPGLQRLARAGLVQAGSGKVRLLGPGELEDGRESDGDDRPPVWGTAHRLIGALERRGRDEAGALLRRADGTPPGEMVRDLAYHLYTVSERRGWVATARGYNSLVVAWPEVGRDA